MIIDFTEKRFEDRSLSFEQKEALLFHAAKTDEGIRAIMECIPGSPTDDIYFDTLKKYRDDGPMLLLAVTAFSIVTKGK